MSTTTVQESGLSSLNVALTAAIASEEAQAIASTAQTVLSNTGGWFSAFTASYQYTVANLTSNVDRYLIAAAQGHVGAQFALAQHFEQAQDFEKAFFYYDQAACQKHVESIYKLGDFAENGKGCEQNDFAAFKCYEIAASLGHAGAQFAVGRCYEQGIGVDQDPIMAIENYDKAVKLGNKQAATARAELQFRLGIFHLTGPEQDLAKAFSYFTKAASEKHACAEFALAQCYRNGYGVQADPIKALDNYKKAALQGHSGAQFILGEFYENGTGGVRKDAYKALDNFKKSAAQGHADALHKLADCSEHGKLGVVIDQNEALKNYLEAARLGNAKAAYRLGTCFTHGEMGVEIDIYEAFRYFEQASAQGLPEAQFAVAACLYFGRGIDQDQEAAARFCKLSAEQNYALAYLCLGEMYEKGTGVEPDKLQAYSCYRQASKLGNDSIKASAEQVLDALDAQLADERKVYH